MNIYNVTLFGHRNLYSHQKIEEKLYIILKKLINTKEYLKIYIGRNGEFDTFVASIIKKYKKN